MYSLIYAVILLGRSFSSEVVWTSITFSYNGFFQIRSDDQATYKVPLKNNSHI